ncbi:MAG: bifunctional metallophosphatase/5'-nucleotidase [bacterium]
MIRKSSHHGALSRTTLDARWSVRRRAAALLAIALALYGCGATAPRTAYPPVVELTILTTNDFHGALEQVDKERDTERPIGGAAWVAATIARERATNPDGAIVVDAGDIYQGTALSNLTQGRASIDYMNAAGFDAAAIGNHEFDWGVPVLLDRIEQAKFPMLVANMRERATGKLPKWAKPYVIVERSGVRVAVIGLITPDTPNTTMPANVEPYEFLDPAAEANALIPTLVPAKADIAVIVCHHGGSMDRDGNLSGEVVEMSEAIVGEAAVVGGHTHQIMHGKVDGVPVVEAGASGRTIGRIDLVVDRAARAVTESSVRVLTVYADSTAPDTSVARLVERYRAEVAPILDEVIGEAAIEIEAARRECGMGNFIADAMREAGGVSFAFQNPGGVRAPLDKGPITYSEIYRVMPFDNTIVTMELTGVEVLQLLEQAVGDGSFLHVSGLRYSADMARPKGSRITVAAATGGVPIVADTVYPIAVNNYMAQGGDSLPLITKRAGARETGIVIREAMAAHIRAETKEGRAISARAEGRVFIEGR